MPAQLLLPRLPFVLSQVGEDHCTDERNAQLELRLSKGQGTILGLATVAPGSTRSTNNHKMRPKIDLGRSFVRSFRASEGEGERRRRPSFLPSFLHSLVRCALVCHAQKSTNNRKTSPPPPPPCAVCLSSSIQQRSAGARKEGGKDVRIG